MRRIPCGRIRFTASLRPVRRRARRSSRLPSPSNGEEDSTGGRRCVAVCGSGLSGSLTFASSGTSLGALRLAAGGRRRIPLQETGLVEPDRLPPSARRPRRGSSHGGQRRHIIAPIGTKGSDPDSPLAGSTTRALGLRLRLHRAALTSFCSGVSGPPARAAEPANSRQRSRFAECSCRDLGKAVAHLDEGAVRAAAAGRYKALTSRRYAARL